MKCSSGVLHQMSVKYSGAYQRRSGATHGGYPMKTYCTLLIATPVVFASALKRSFHLRSRRLVVHLC